MTKRIACVVLLVNALAWSAEREMVPLEVKRPKPVFHRREHRQGHNLEPGWREGKAGPAVMVPKGSRNLALEKPVTSSAQPVLGSLEQVTDGDKECVDGSWIELPEGRQWVQIDLGRRSGIHALALWHFYGVAAIYVDVVIQASDDPEFKTDVVTLFNNDADDSLGLGKGKDFEYVEEHMGKIVPVKDVSARYVGFGRRGTRRTITIITSRSKCGAGRPTRSQWRSSFRRRRTTYRGRRRSG